VPQFALLGIFFGLPTQLVGGQIERCSRLKQAVEIQLSAVQRNFPAAKLFQVFVPNVNLGATSSEEGCAIEIRSLLGTIGADTYVEATGRLGELRETKITTRKFGQKDCFYGYPSDRSETCVSIIRAPTNPNEYLTMEWDLDWKMLASVLHEHGFNASSNYDITIASVERVLPIWEADSSAYADGIAALAAIVPSDVVLIVTEHSADRIQAGRTLLFRGKDQAYLGTIRAIPRRRLPPAR
jgi:hypothetical protein